MQRGISPTEIIKYIFFVVVVIPTKLHLGVQVRVTHGLEQHMEHCYPHSLHLHACHTRIICLYYTYMDRINRSLLFSEFTVYNMLCV